MSDIFATLFLMIFDWHDLFFAALVLILNHYRIIEVTAPACITRWFETEDLAPITTFYSEETR